MVAEADDELMEKFFEAGTLTQDELVAGLRKAVIGRPHLPARLHVGHPQRRHPAAARRHPPVPAVARRPRVQGGAGEDRRRRRWSRRPTRRRTPPSSGRRWPTRSPAASRMFRVMSGTLKADCTVHNLTRETPERLGHLVLLQGKTQTDVPEIKAGDLGAVAKLKDTRTNDTLADKGGRRASRRSRSPSRCSPTRSSRRAAATRTRSARALQRLQEEDPSIRYEPRSADQGAAAVRPGPAAHRGDGREAEAPLRRRGQPQAAAHPLPRDDHRLDRGARAATRSRRAATASSATASIKMEPLPRGADFEFVDDIFGGSIPRQFRPGGREGHPGRAPARATWPATRWWTSGSRSSTASSTRWTRTSCRSRWRAAWRSRTACRARGRRSSSRS